jgi:hypothetical protein
MSLSPQARKAIEYCKSINADPFEPVLGVNSPKERNEPAGPFITMPRWQFYVGARIEQLKDKSDENK